MRYNIHVENGDKKKTSEAEDLAESEHRRLEREKLKLEVELNMKKAEVEGNLIQVRKEVDRIIKEEEEAVALEDLRIAYCS